MPSLGNTDVVGAEAAGLQKTTERLHAQTRVCVCVYTFICVCLSLCVLHLFFLTHPSQTDTFLLKGPV